jgi:hypothetical protein
MDDLLGAIDLAESYGLKVIDKNLGLFDDEDDQIRAGLNSGLLQGGRRSTQPGRSHRAAPVPL